MRKGIAILMGMMAAVSLTACDSGSTASSGGSDSSSAAESSAAESSSSASSSETVPEEPVSEAEPSASAGGEDASGGTLVVYFSATGNTEEAAGYIASLTGGDLFELEPVEPYTSEDLNYSDDNSRVSLEYADESLREVELSDDTVENWDDYDTVFIGYPIWWGIAAWAVDGFIEANDFTGKTVIPFCTSSSSGLGQSGKLLAELAGTGDWQEGQRFSSGVSEADVEEWLSTLGLS